MKKIIPALLLLAIYILPAFSLSDESKADLRRIADWWEAREDKLNERLGELERENPDPSNPDDKTWQEYLKVLDEIKTAEEKQKLYRETARFDYTREIIKGTVQAYRPAADFMEFTFDRGVELVKALISQSWQDLVKISVDSVLRARIRAKIRSELGCSETVPGLENWLVIMGFGEDPWSTTVDQAALKWAKGDAQSKAMLLSLQMEKGRQIYKDYLEKPQIISAAANAGGDPLQWLEDKTKASGEKVMNALGLATFVTDIGGRLWISLDMEDSVDYTLENLKVLRAKYKEKDIDLSCEDLFLVWSKQKTIDLEDPEEKARLEKLKTGLEFFKKKIPGWYQSKTVPDHFEEIVRMIPIAEELGEYDTAENLRDILKEFGYKKMTPEEIAAAEKQSLIDENRKYLISHLKGLKNLLVHKNYDEVESKWEITKGAWEDLIELGYNTDTDKEIQNLWKEIEPMMKKAAEIENTGDKSNSIGADDSGSPAATLKLPVFNEVNYKDKFLSIAKKYHDEAEDGNYNLAKMYYTAFIAYAMYLNKNKNISISQDNKWIDDMGEQYFDLEDDILDNLEKANSLKGNPNYGKFRTELLNYISSYKNKLRTFGKDAIDTEKNELNKLAIKWGLWGINFENDLNKDPELSAEYESIFDLEDKILKEKDDSEGNHIKFLGPPTINNSF